MKCPVGLLLVLFTLLQLCTGVKWLALYRYRKNAWDSPKECRKSTGLSGVQLKLCQQYLDLMGTIALASSKGIDSCQKQFYDRRWNCSSLVDVPKLSKDIKRGTREQAFVYAISSATLMHSVARACSIGITTKCSCGKLPDETPRGDYKWGGCGDDVEFGLRFSELFTSYHTISKSKNKKTMMNSHNIAAGNKIVEDSLTTACKCHGVSGSCTIKTCWRSLADFDTISRTLKDKYGMAIEVKRKRKDNVHTFVPTNNFKKIKNIPHEELVYIQKSPDYCSVDRKMGSIGTRHRTCDPSSEDPKGCGTMCCGRGYDSSDVTIVERCECKYYWCCYVKCKTCSKTIRLHRCR